MIEGTDYESVLTPEEKIAMARDVLSTIELPQQSVSPRRTSLERASGVARGKGPPPSDADVKRWIDEYRMEKYG